MSRLKPSFLGWMQPEHPCRELPTRHCPAVYDAVCGDDRPCARYESDDETPWLPEVYDCQDRSYPPVEKGASTGQ